MRAILLSSLILAPISGRCAGPAMSELMGFAGPVEMPKIGVPAGSPIGLVRGSDAPIRYFRVRFAAAPQQAAAAPAKGLITFDDPSMATESSAAQQLARLGITVTDVTEETKLEVVNAEKDLYGGQAARAASGANLMTQNGPAKPMGFTLRFSAPVTEFRFKRAALIAATEHGVVHPGWMAKGLDKDGRVVVVNGEMILATYVDVPAREFVIKAPRGMHAVRFESDGQAFAGFNAVLLDDIELR